MDKQLGETILNRQGKIGIDVLGNQTVFTSRVNNLEEESKLRHATGLLSSFYESEVIKQFTGLQAVSTSEVLNISSEQNIEILYLSSANISELNNSKLSDQNKADITKLINEGNYVTVPSEEISIGNWSGTGYIVYDPVTDLNSYIINTNLNGGQLCSWVGLAYLGSVLLSVVECTWAVYMIAGGIALVMAALGGASLIIGIGIGAFAAVIAFTPVITMIIGAGLIIGGALYLKNVGDRLQNQTELMTRYLDGDSLAGEALKRNAVWQAVGVGTTFVVGRVLSKHVSAATARVHFETNYGRLPGEYGNIPNGYTVANDVANSLVNSGVSTSLIQSASQNVNFISYTPAVINALSRVPTATAEQFVLTIANTNGDGVLIAVDNSGVQIDDVVKLIALHRVDYANTVAVINKIHSSTATSMELMSLYNALTRQTTRTADLVTDAAILERVRVIRNILPSDLKRSGNFGLANVSISGLKNEWYAHSGIDVLSDARSAADLVTDISLQPQNPTVEAIEAPVGSANNYLRDMDTEYKILNDIANQLGDNVNATGTIKLFTERSPCDSCQNIIARFLEKYPNIEIEVVHNDGTVLKP